MVGSYYLTQKTKPYSPVLAGLNRLGYKQLVQIIRKEQPEAIILHSLGSAPVVGHS